MKESREKGDRILWVEAFGFSLLIALCWLTEWTQIPRHLFGEAFAPDWKRAALRSIVILLVWTSVHLATKRLLRRLHYLEEFLRVCSWCRKVCHDDEWMPMETYFKSKFSTKTTHGMCPECLQKKKDEFAPKSSTQLG